MDGRLENDQPPQRQRVAARKFAALCEENYGAGYPMLAPAATVHLNDEDTGSFDEQILAGLVNV